MAKGKDSAMITVLAGGVGAAKLILGLSHILPPERIAVIGNTGDDLELFGLRICPDLDTITYTLAGKVNPAAGWGILGDTFECLQMLGSYGGQTWFKLGDHDLATHLWRTHLLKQGLSLAEVTQRISEAHGLRSQLLPMSNAYTPTFLLTDQGELHLQEYLVREQGRPRVREIRYSNIEQAQPVPGTEEALLKAEVILIGPSNPFISIGPILAVPGMKELLLRTSAPVIAVTPIVCGQAIKGPAAKMLQELGHPVSALSVAQIYRDFVDVFVLDERDLGLREEVRNLGIDLSITDTIMDSLDDKIRLARRLLEFA
jgi:LPPG:FO 2-phospho-L-lactate transferase